MVMPREAPETLPQLFFQSLYSHKTNVTLKAETHIHAHQDILKPKVSRGVLLVDRRGGPKSPPPPASDKAQESFRI